MLQTILRWCVRCAAVESAQKYGSGKVSDDRRTSSGTYPSAAMGVGDSLDNGGLRFV